MYDGASSIIWLLIHRQVCSFDILGHVARRAHRDLGRAPFTSGTYGSCTFSLVGCHCHNTASRGPDGRHEMPFLHPNGESSCLGPHRKYEWICMSMLW